MKLETVADWQALLSHRLETAREACCEITDQKSRDEFLDEYGDLLQEADAELRMLCNRAHKFALRVRRYKPNPVVRGATESRTSPPRCSAPNGSDDHGTEEIH